MDDEVELTDVELDAYVDALDIAEQVWEQNKRRRGKKNMNIILYSTHCPRCRGVEMMLKAKHIPYEERTDEEEMKSLGITSAPVLSVDGELKVGKSINEFINNYRG